MLRNRRPLGCTLAARPRTLLSFNTQSARKGHVNRCWVAKPDFKIVEYGLWATSTILGLLTLMRRHVFKFPSRPFPATLGSSSVAMM